MKKRQKGWFFRPEKTLKPKVPENVKMEVEIKAGELVESFLKPNHIKPPHEDERFSYVVDIYKGLSVDECLADVKDDPHFLP